MGLSDEDKILIKNLHDSKGNVGYGNGAKKTNARVSWKGWSKRGLSCSVVSTRDKSIVWMNWNGGSSMSGAILNSRFVDEAIDQWREKLQACVRALLEGHFEYTLWLWTDNVDFAHICYIPCDLFDCCIFNYVIIPATLAYTFLFRSVVRW